MTKKDDDNGLPPFVVDLAKTGMEQSAHYVQTNSSLITMAKQGRLPETLYLGCMTALGAISATAMMVANKPKLTDEEISERGAEEAAKLVNSDTILFVALLICKMQRSHKYFSKGDYEGIEGTIAYGPRTYRAALDEWERVTGKNADGILDPRMLEVARKAEPLDGPDPFQQWMKDRKTKNQSTDGNVIQFPSSETKH